jgi:hypothetical protein
MRVLAVALLACGAACGPTLGQPNMESALRSLEAARTSLERAAHNKGGHRVRALALTNQAIVEVQTGIQVGAQ